LLLCFAEKVYLSSVEGGTATSSSRSLGAAGIWSDTVMGYEPTELHTLIEEIKRASASIASGDTKMHERIKEIEASVNDLFKRVSRPGGFTDDKDEASARKHARELCIVKHDLQQPKVDVAAAAYEPSTNEIDEAVRANRAMKALWRHADPGKLDHMERKSLSAFSMGNTGFLFAPEMSSQVLRCLVEPTDLTGMMNRVAIGSGSVKFLIDNSQMEIANWACETSCFHNNPQPNLQEGLGELSRNIAA
jgi:HK97 family phage major capsid protein